jgi:anti-sigma B factor antagonist
MGDVGDQVVGPDLVLHTEADGDGTLLTVRGELDAYTAPGLEEQIARLIESGARRIVLDLSETAFLDSSGLRAILTSQRKVAEATGELRLRRPSEPVTRLLEITGLTEHFPVD